MVIFNIRLNKFLTQEQLTDVSLLTHAERNIVEFGKILEAAKGIRQNANRIYGTHSYRKAIRMYVLSFSSKSLKTSTLKVGTYCVILHQVSSGH